ncbi:hypothetical protein BWI17_13565 [Betaproteobacteria bacterium GR16-43]|nr:hypothetical protein BWI17_13565 [Betaproteobacteria bacterium GR16-43]
MPNRYPDGHFYSPTVDFAEVERDSDRIWPAAPQVLGIDFDDDSHQRILTEHFPRFIRDYDYPEQLEDSPTLDAYYTGNSQFGWLDSRTLFVLLRTWQPRRLVEVGSGYSSLLIADVVRRFLDGRCQVTCIEPYPRPFLRNGIKGIERLIEARVQDVAISEFEQLESGDVLFIDSSHVSKTGSDVNHLLFNVLPRLRRGVRIHFHDIFLPHDYLREWVLTDGRSWNEQYLLQALLMYSTTFRPLFGSFYAFSKYPDLVRDALALPSGKSFGGGSFWIEKVA